MRIRSLITTASFLALGAFAQANNTEPCYAGVSSDAEMLIIVDMQSLSQSTLAQMIETMMQQGQPPADPNALAMGFTEFTGATRADLSKAALSTSDVIALRDMEGEPDAEAIDMAKMMFAIQFNKAISKSQFDDWVQSQLEANETENTEKEDVGDGVLYTNQVDNPELGLGFLPAGEQSVVFIGSKKGVTEAIKAGKGTLPKSMATAQSLLPSIPNIMMLAAPSERWKAEFVKDNAGQGGDMSYIEEADEIAAGLNFSDGIKLLSGVKFDNEKKANEAYTSLNESISALKAQMSNPSQPNPMLMMFGSVIQNLQISENGDQVNVSTEMGAAESQQLLMMLPMMLMQMQMQQGGGGMQPGMQPGAQPAPGM